MKQGFRKPKRSLICYVSFARWRGCYLCIPRHILHSEP